MSRPITHTDASRLALGTVQFGLDYGVSNMAGQVPVNAVRQMLDLASVSGVNTLDTASLYGNSEEVLGEAGTGRFRIVTKLAPLPETCADADAIRRWVFEELEGSLTRLRVSKVETVLLHRPEQLLQPRGKHLYEALAKLKENGKTGKIGISIYNPELLTQIMDAYQFDCIQAPFNLVDRSLLTSGWLTRLHADGVEIHTRSAFLQGLLLMTGNQMPAHFSRWSTKWQKWSNWLKDNHCSPLRAALSFPLGFPEISRVVVGAVSPKQLEEIIAAANEPLRSDFVNLQSDDPALINPSNWSA